MTRLFPPTATTGSLRPTADRSADWFGIVCSLGCAVHCAAMPVLIAVAPSVAVVGWMADPLFHQVLAILCVAMVVRGIAPGWLEHGDSVVLHAAVIGVALILIAAFVIPDQCCVAGAGHHEAVSLGSLFSVPRLHQWLGGPLAGALLATQPWMTPAGGLCLIVAHLVNIRLRCCKRGGCGG